jgi:hypothetical protein
MIQGSFNKISTVYARKLTTSGMPHLIAYTYTNWKRILLASVKPLMTGIILKADSIMAIYFTQNFAKAIWSHPDYQTFHLKFIYLGDVLQSQ